METIACPMNDLFCVLVAVPPSSPRVISEDGHIDTTGAVAGVYQEDESMRLKCEVVGGKSTTSQNMQRYFYNMKWFQVALCPW